MKLTLEERAALERLRRGNISSRTQEILNAALLRLCLADDDEPIDEAWLRSVGFNDGWGGHEGGLRIGFKAIGDNLDFHCMRTWRINKRPIVNSPKTRGQLRRLAAALDITLEETR